MELTQLDGYLKKTAHHFVEQLKLKLSGNLKSAFVYASAARGEYSKRHSDINILLVLATVDTKSLKIIGAAKRKSAFAKLATLVLSKEDVESSTDTFPMEFLDIKEDYVLLWGDDCLKNLIIDLKNLRHQCEWELKSKIIQARQFYLNSFGHKPVRQWFGFPYSQSHKNALRNFLLQSISSFFTIFKNILRLRGISENSKEKILERIAQEFGLSVDILGQLWQMRQGSGKITDIEEAFEAFLETLRELSHKVDALPGA